MKLIKDSFNDLQEEFPDADLGSEFERFSDYMLSIGKQYEDYAAAFRGWLRKISYFES